MRRTGATRKAAALALAAAGALYSSSHLQAATAWKGTTGDWFLASNWTAGVPTSFAQAQINNGGTAQLAGSANPSPLDLGTSAGESGSVLFSAGIFTAGTVNVGLGGSGAFTQSGGTYSIGSALNAGLFIGQATGGNGTYNLGGGLLSGSSSILNVGYRSTGTLSQTGGTESAGTVILGGQAGGAGRYDLSAGTLASPIFTVNSAASSFTQTGGTMTVSTFTQSAGSASFPSLTIALAAGANTRLYNLTGGTLTAPTISVTSAAGQFTMGSSALLSCTTFNISAGSATFPTALLDSGTATLSIPTPGGVPQPAINWTGGSITPTNEFLGAAAGSYTYTHPTSGLTFRPANLYLAFASGSNALFSMPGGSLTADKEVIGNSGNGTFAQSDGTHTVLTSLTLGGGVGSTGTYLLSGGTLNAPAETLGGGSGFGTFTQSGGTNNASTMTITSRGIYNLQAGTLLVGNFNWDANSHFNRTGGTLNAATFTQQSGDIVAGGANSPFLEPLVLGTLANGGEAGTYLPFGGTLTANTITIRSGGDLRFVQGGSGKIAANTVNLQGGQISVFTVTLDSGSPVFTIPTPVGVPQPTLNLTSGTLYGQNVNLGTTAGTFNYTQSGGFTMGGTIYVGFAAGSSGTYILPAGQSINAELNVGSNGAGTFNQNGGTVSGGVRLKGVYNQSAGARTGWMDIQSGSYTQSGGSNTVVLDTPGGIFSVGSSGSATYNLSAGTLDATTNINATDIGIAAASSFNQSGGTHTGNQLQIGAGSVPGTYNLSGGMLHYVSATVTNTNSALSVSNDAAQFDTDLSSLGKIILAGRNGSSTAGSINGLVDLHLLPNSEFDVGIGGPSAATDYGQISAINVALLNDVTLNVTLTNGYFPSGGQTFRILNGSFSGVPFTTVHLPPNWAISYNPHDVTLTAIPEPAGVFAVSVAGLAIPMLRRRRVVSP